ncbi:MAG: cytochrome c biogenesis protein CcdA [Tissierellia bacterium]|nr:cytochrome c biogenesis protein CcdA [Tissierellia bacterium]
MLNNILYTIGAGIREGGVMLPLFAILGGFLTSLTPCSLTSLPIIITYLGAGKEMNTKKAFKLSLSYALGNALTFAILGVIASLIGKLISFTGSLWYIFLGILMIIVALQMFGVIDIFSKINLNGNIVKHKRFGAFVLGIISGVFASPCATPVMIALMAIISGTGASILKGIVLFLLYALGHGIIVVIVGSTMGGIDIANEGYKKFSKIFNIIFGILVLALGLYMLYLGF